MVRHRRIPSSLVAFGMVVVALAILTACTSSSGTDAGAPPASCAVPGGPTMGPPDMHCGSVVQAVNPASCHSTGGTGGNLGDDGGPVACGYGDTTYGTQSDDDDCKYHVNWSSTSVCEGAGGVVFTMTVTSKTDGSKVTGMMPYAEVFTSVAVDGGCDIGSTHPGPDNGVRFQEGPAGTYTGSIVFDAPGLWTVRFHFREECNDVPDSPHGHAAYHVTVP
ncbi:MAG: hypothetical protein M3O46_18885 [Myxococcota bacterium]|nr:hypothetical protein [Myxococcota bacterium]